MKWITAANLEAWGRTNASESELPALVADLISATGKDITSIRFPSGDKGRTRGLDGILECDGEPKRKQAAEQAYAGARDDSSEGQCLNE